MNNELEQWEEERNTTPVNIQQITKLVESLKEAKNDYDAKKAEATNAEKFYKGLRMDVLAILKAAGQSKFFAEGIGTVSVTQKLSVTVPKTHEEKNEMLQFFAAQGQDVFLTYATVNSMSLNSYYKLQTEEYAKKGETFSIPGVGAPTMMENISFRKG